MNPNLLLEEIRSGDQNSFKRLFDLFYHPLVIYAEGYLFDRASSEDMVQEVFIYFWNNADKMQISTSVKGYLFKMVRNRCLNYLKSIKLTDYVESPEFFPGVQSDHPDELQDKSLRKFNEVLLCVETMPGRMKEIFNLKYRQNYSYSEISNELGISVNTIKTQIKRARNILQSQFPTFMIIWMYLIK